MRPSEQSRRWLEALANRIESINILVGRSVGWLTLAMVLVTTAIVVLRYGLQTGAIRLQESLTFMHAAVFMLAAGYTLAAGEHVRVDIFYSRFSVRGQAWVNVTGTLLLLIPVAVFLLWTSHTFVGTAWQIREASGGAGGLPYPFPALMKSFIPLAAGLLLLQAVAILLRGAAVLLPASRAER